jgi:hypothetical protein
VALIEISLDKPFAVAARPPAYRYRVPGLGLAVLLVLALAGAVPVAAVRWQHAGLVPLAADADFQIAGGRLFTLEVTGGRRLTSAWALSPLRRLWRATTTAEDSAGGLIQGGSSVTVAGDVVLLRAGATTTVLDARTGAVRWTSPLPIVALSDTVGMVQDEQFQPGTEYDESSGAPGALFFSAAGRPHTRPPLRTDLTGVDLATGRTRWIAPFAGSIYPARARGVPGALIVLAAGTLWLRSALDGSVLRSQALPSGPGSAWGNVVGNLLMIRQAGVVSAYTITDLEKRWQRSEPADDGNSASCAGLTCVKSGRRLLVLDPATGVPRWHTGGDVDLLPAAGYALEMQSGLSRPLRAVDLGTGAARVDLRDWQTFALAPGDAGSPIVLSRQVAGGGVKFGVLMPGRPVVQVLGVTRAAVTDCFADTHLLACRARAGIEVFTYAS